MHSQLMFNECIAQAEFARSLHCSAYPSQAQKARDGRQDRQRRLCPQFGIECVQRTSQHRTRRRNRTTSDCFLRCSSSTYLRAPIVTIARKKAVSEAPCLLAAGWRQRIGQTVCCSVEIRTGSTSSADTLAGGISVVLRKSPVRNSRRVVG